MEFTAIAPAANRSKLWRIFATVALAAAWAASPAYAVECDPDSENDPVPPGTVGPGTGGDSDCRIDVSGPLEGPPTVPEIYPGSGVIEGPTRVTYLDVCGSWGLSNGVNNEITFAELEYYSDARGTPSTVIVLTAARVNGTPSLVVDLVNSVPRGWSLTNAANQLPLTPLATLPLNDCKADISEPFLGLPFEIKLVDNKIQILVNQQPLVTWPSPLATPRWRPALYPGALRVMQLRAENASGSTVARTLWTFAP